jgi:hypothetical protein
MFNVPPGKGFSNQELARIMTALIISEGLPRPRDCPPVPRRTSEEILEGMRKKYRWMRDVKEKTQ